MRGGGQKVGLNTIRRGMKDVFRRTVLQNVLRLHNWAAKTDHNTILKFGWENMLTFFEAPP